MLERLVVREGQSPDSARRQLDHALMVPGWAVPGREPRETTPRDPGAPWWWESAQEASDSFLKSMGVVL